MAQEFDLDSRDGLPDALRVLVEAYPREVWNAHDNFNGLVKFWMERHMMFRKLMKMLSEDLAAYSAGSMEAETYLPRLQRFASLFINELYTHHHIEDHQYFPVLIAMENRLQRGFEILDRDHQAIDQQLHRFANDANRLLTGMQKDTEASIDGFATCIEELGGFLDRHLTDEEELVVPIVLKHGFQ